MAGMSGAELEPFDDGLRDTLLKQIVELQNANDELANRLFKERQKSVTQITQTFQKYRLERQKDHDRIEDLQTRLADAENEKEQLQTELDRNRQLCGFAHNKLLQQQNMVKVYMDRLASLQEQFEVLTADNAQLRLVYEANEAAAAAGAATAGKAAGAAVCPTCAALNEILGVTLSPERLARLVQQSLDAAALETMSTQTDGVERQTRAVQTTVAGETDEAAGPAEKDNSTRPSSAATAEVRENLADLEEGEILQSLEKEIADSGLAGKRRRRNRPKRAEQQKQPLTT